MAMFSMLEAITPKVAKNIARRSRGMTGGDRLGCQAQHLADVFFDRGSMLAKVPTAPEIAPVAISARA